MTTSGSFARSEALPESLSDARLQDVGPVGDAQRRQGVLLDQQDRRALLADRRDRVEDQVDEHRREAHRRLVEQQQLGPPHQRAPDREHLLLAAGHGPGLLVEPLLAAAGRGSSTRSRSAAIPALSLRRNAPRSRFSVDGHAREDPAPLGRLADAARRRSRDPAMPVIGRPWNMIVPCLGLSSPEMVRRVVDLPAPLEPISVTISPSLTVRRQPLHRGDVAVVDVDVVDREHRPSWSSVVAVICRSPPRRTCPGTPR